MARPNLPARLVLAFLLASAPMVVPNACGQARSAPVSAWGDVRVAGTGRPQLVFACEMDTNSLESLFSDPAVAAELRELNAGVALATIDLSEGRAQAVRKLNQAGIPVTAWIALPREQGYYLNAGHVAEAGTRFNDFQKWTSDYGLRWAAVGLDVEPSLSEFGDIRSHKLRLAAALFRRSFDSHRVQRARDAYSALVRRMQSDGYPVETYQFPFIADERRIHSTILERLFGIVDLRPQTDEALMTYTSFNHALDSALIWLYGPEAQTIVVGSTASSGDPEIDAKFPPLNWDEFSRDLIVASHFSRVVGVYSLVGCVRQGFLPRLETMDWKAEVTVPAEALRKASRLRTRIQNVLWIASHAVYFLLALVVLVAWLIWRYRRVRSKRGPQPLPSGPAPSPQGSRRSLC